MMGRGIVEACSAAARKFVTKQRGFEISATACNPYGLLQGNAIGLWHADLYFSNGKNFRGLVLAKP